MRLATAKRNEGNNKLTVASEVAEERSFFYRTLSKFIAGVPSVSAVPWGHAGAQSDCGGTRSQG